MVDEVGAVGTATIWPYDGTPRREDGLHRRPPPLVQVRVGDGAAGCGRLGGRVVGDGPGPRAAGQLQALRRRPRPGRPPPRTAQPKRAPASPVLLALGTVAVGPLPENDPVVAFCTPFSQVTALASAAVTSAVGVSNPTAPNRPSHHIPIITLSVGKIQRSSIIKQPNTPFRHCWPNKKVATSSTVVVRDRHKLPRLARPSRIHNMTGPSAHPRLGGPRSPQLT